QYKEIDIRAIRQKQIDCEDFETSIKNIDISDTNDAIVDVKLINLTALQSIDIQNSQIKELFPNAMSVNIKREFKKNANETNIDDVEALSLEDFFIEHIKEDSDNKEFDRLKTKVQELFSLYEESSNDTM
ncbi:MAG: DNA double-strand break repair protein Mre11, partial [Poseidonibacter sp.]